ncbi:unnamed protein product [Linum trigynum]|uniref:DUF7755 domain-containing protein n=2 Tax=Linum trigynum TaxID=586398 RepID=A0AAV2EJX2_9ROSI
MDSIPLGQVPFAPTNGRLYEKRQFPVKERRFLRRHISKRYQLATLKSYKRSDFPDFREYAKPSRLLGVSEPKLCTETSWEQSISSSFSAGDSPDFYKVKLQTSNMYGSGLDDQNAGVLLCLVDDKGNAVLQRIPSISKSSLADSADIIESEVVHFQRGATDEFFFEGPQLGRIEALWIGVESGQWRLDSVSLTKFDGPQPSLSRVDEVSTVPFSGFHYEFDADDILLGEKDDLSMVELRPRQISKLSEVDPLTISTTNSTSSPSSKVSNEESMREYADLKLSLLSYDAMLILGGTLLLNFSAGENSAVAFLIGGMCGFSYLLLLQRSVDGLEVSGMPSGDRNGMFSQVGGGVIKGTLPIVSLALGLGLTLAAARYGFGDIDPSLVSPKELIVGMLGFLVCKVAVLMAAFKPIKSDWFQRKTHHPMAMMNSRAEDQPHSQSTAMDEISSPSQQQLPISTTTKTIKKKQLTLIPLIFLIYFEVAGGPYGEEPAVQAAGPLYAILGFLIFPFIWSIPEALITAELSTAYPGNGGFVIWADRAFGPFFGSLMGSWKFLSGVINVAAFPVLCIDYLKKVIPALQSGWPRTISIWGSTLFLSFLNYTGLVIVGYFAVFLGIVSLSPFIIMSILAIPKIKPRRWISLGDKGVKKDWNLFFNTLFWNLNFWDSVSTLAGEVDKPAKTFPLALLIAVIFTCVSYLIPLFAVIGAVAVEQSAWESGFHATAAELIAGKWLKYWVEIGAALSAVGLFEAQLSSCVYQLLGMADLGILPIFFALRSKWFNTPWVGILVSTVITLGCSYMDFADIISSANFLYTLGMLLEFAAFLWLRRKLPELKRPYRVPMRLPGLIVMCLIPSGFLVIIMVVATKTVLLVSGLMTAGAVGWFFLMKFCKAKRLCIFNSESSSVAEDE